MTRNGRIDGTVMDLKEEIPIGNVEIVLDSGGANAAGAFAFDGVREGRHLIATNGGAYLARVDTITMPVGGGLQGTLFLKLRQDVTKGCDVYRPVYKP